MKFEQTGLFLAHISRLSRILFISIIEAILLFYFSDLSKERKVKLVIVESFSSESEDVKSAAAYALGKTTLHISSLHCTDIASILDVSL